MRDLRPAELLLQRLGVTKPSHIDLAAIAWTLGARVRYRPLDSCEARIIGHGDQAIITVNSRSHHRRQRFSLAHELGHWSNDRGRLLVCRAEDIGRGANGRNVTERAADRYAADMLMPRFLFEPISRTYSRLTIQSVEELCDVFDVSRTAVLIRLMDVGHSPALIICHGVNGRKWFVRGKGVPEHWFPKDQLDPDSLAFDILFGKESNDTMPHKIGAHAWFDRRGANAFEITEQTVRIGDQQILSIILIEDDDMLDGA